jgi:hypothetical protein
MMRTRQNPAFSLLLATIAWIGVVLQCVLTVKSALGNGKTAAEGAATFSATSPC